MALMEALVPMAEAMQRLDNRQQETQQQQHTHLKYQEELLMEVLNSLQPSAQEQLSLMDGSHPPMTMPSVSGL